MTGLNHALTGTTIALTVRSPLLALLMATISHFALDALPHFGGVTWFGSWNKRTAIIAIADGVITLLTMILSFFLFVEARWLTLSCALLATMPDWPWLINYLFKKEHWYFRWHQAIQRYERPWGAIVEVIFGVSLVFTLAIMHN